MVWCNLLCINVQKMALLDRAVFLVHFMTNTFIHIAPWIWRYYINHHHCVGGKPGNAWPTPSQPNRLCLVLPITYFSLMTWFNTNHPSSYVFWDNYKYEQVFMAKTWKSNFLPCKIHLTSILLNKLIVIIIKGRSVQSQY